MSEFRKTIGRVDLHVSLYDDCSGYVYERKLTEQDAISAVETCMVMPFQQESQLKRVLAGEPYSVQLAGEHRCLLRALNNAVTRAR